MKHHLLILLIVGTPLLGWAEETTILNEAKDTAYVSTKVATNSQVGEAQDPKATSEHDQPLKNVLLDDTKHEIRIGWGDMMSETLVHHPTATTCNYRYTGHFFAEYQYTINRWLSVGGQLDYQQVWWCDDDKYHVLKEIVHNRNYYNIAIMPTVRFTYFRKKWVSLYSDIEIGLNINGGSEKNYKGKRVACSPVFGATLLAVEMGAKNWYGIVGILGGLTALNNPHEVYMLCSRMFSVSVSRRF